MYFRYLLLAVSLVLVPCVVPHDDSELRVEVLEADVVEIKDNVEDVESSVTQNTGQLFEVINDVDDMDDLTLVQEQRIGALEEVNSLLQAQLDELVLMLTSTNQRVDALNETVSYDDNSANDRLDTLEGDVTVLGSDLAELDETTDQRLTVLEESVADYSFLASHSAVTFTPSDPIVFDVAILNPGFHYDPVTGIYTVPVDGIYQFVLHYTNAGDYRSGAWLVVDNVRVAFTPNDDADASSHTADIVLLQSLTTGQQVWISPSEIERMYGTSSDGYIYSWFSGHLIYAL